MIFSPSATTRTEIDLRSRRNQIRTLTNDDAVSDASIPPSAWPISSADPASYNTLNWPLGLLADGPLRSLDCALDSQVQHISQASGRAFSDISDQYFQTFHRWLPVVSRELLHEVENTYQDRYPPADLSLLMLAMYLITLHPAKNAKNPVSPEILYLKIRVLFAHTQAIIHTSPRLVQTGLLLAAYEYACRKPDAAYISMGTCIRIASILGIDQVSLVYDSQRKDTTQKLESLERQYMWWGMVILERLILCDIHARRIQPAFRFPDPDTRLPAESNFGDVADSTPCHPHTPNTPTVEAIDSPNITCFGRQIQAIYLLSQVLEVTTGVVPTNLPTLTKLDEKLWRFLAILINDSWQKQHCTANGIVIRSLLYLHQHILSQPTDSSGKPLSASIYQNSHAALDTLARMMVEVAQDHLECLPKNFDSLPLSCSYNLRAAMELINGRWAHDNSERCSKGLGILVSLYQAVCRRWVSDL